jgi:divalent metal cation (Fe/Co/Zn/Cd) transporter
MIWKWIKTSVCQQEIFFFLIRKTKFYMWNSMDELSSKAENAGRSVTLIGVLINALLIIFKFLAGVFGRSQALIADAVHSVSDLFTDVVVLLGLKIGRKAPDQEHQYGHGRIETLASAIVGMALIATALYLGIQASFNIYKHTEYHPTRLALFAAATSIVLKEVLYRYTLRVGRRIRSPLILANAWHHRSDALSSVAVLIGVTGALIKPPEILSQVTQCARSVEGVINIHDLRARTTGGSYQMEAHIVVDGRLTVIEGHRIAKAVEKCLLEEVDGIDRVTVHVDPKIDEEEPVRRKSNKTGNTPAA